MRSSPPADLAPWFKWHIYSSTRLAKLQETKKPIQIWISVTVVLFQNTLSAMVFGRGKEDRPTPSEVYNWRLYGMAFLTCVGTSQNCPFSNSHAEDGQFADSDT